LSILRAHREVAIGSSVHPILDQDIRSIRICGCVFLELKQAVAQSDNSYVLAITRCRVLEQDAL